MDATLLHPDSSLQLPALLSHTSHLSLAQIACDPARLHAGGSKRGDRGVQGEREVHTNIHSDTYSAFYTFLFSATQQLVEFFFPLVGLLIH